MRLLILGAGQFGMLTREIAESTGRFEKIDFLDDGNPIAVGKLSCYEQLRTAYDRAIVAIGNPAVRLEWLHRLRLAGYTVASLISPAAYVSSSAELGEGAIVEPMAVVQTGAALGAGCIVSSGAVVRHNAVLGAGCHCDCNSVILSTAVVPDGTKIPCGTCRA